MSRFDVSYPKLAQLLLPMCLRGKSMTALTKVLVSPIGLLHGELMKFRMNTRHRLVHNGQTCYLRGMLNDTFDPVERGIIITEDGSDEGMGIMLHERETGLFLNLTMRERGCAEAFRRGFNGANRVGFWINIPVRLKELINEGAVRAVVNQFKLASIRYGITYTN